MLSLFGKDVKQNIFIMITLTDAEEPPSRIPLKRMTKITKFTTI